jgi:hypothetical protein
MISFIYIYIYNLGGHPFGPHGGGTLAKGVALWLRGWLSVPRPFLGVAGHPMWPKGVARPPQQIFLFLFFKKIFKIIYMVQNILVLFYFIF